MKFDVAIIGAGPGGGMAACRLAESGLKTVILEKSTLPRPKPCGGAMPSRVKQVISWDFDALVENRVHTIRNQFDHSQEQQVSGTISPILMVSRPRFDQHLIDRALVLGKGDVELREQFRVAQVEEDAEGVSIRAADGATICADYVIAADGAYSKTASCLGLNRNATVGAAMDAEVEVTPEVYEAEKGRATFNFFCLPNGYGWIFPKGDYLSCGVGAWQGNPKLPGALDDFLKKSLPPGSIRSIHVSGHAIPLYSGTREIATRRVCLVGDAASLVEPILGEGIRFAMFSGGAAVEVVLRQFGLMRDSNDAAENKPPLYGDCRDYQAAIQRTLGEPLGNLRRFISPLFFQAPAFFYRKFIIESNNYFGLSQQLALEVQSPTHAS